MDTQVLNQKLELIQWLSSIEDQFIIKKLIKFKKKEAKDWWSEMSIKEQEEIKTGLKQADKGEYTAHETVMKRFNKWH